jgi:hypothetical protein
LLRFFLLAALAAVPVLATAKNKKIEEIDAYCSGIESKLRSTAPYVLTGPDPWVLLDAAPAEMEDSALAFVYAEGPRIRWVFIRLAAESGQWLEDVNYYYDPAGSLVRRTRHLDYAPANLQLDETIYFDEGEVFKEKVHHRNLRRGKQDTGNFVDQDPPAFVDVDDLPFLDLLDLTRRIIWLPERLIQIP